MCELFALNAREPVAVNDLLGEFYAHSVKHPHGWGLAWRDGDHDEHINVLKEPIPAVESEFLHQTLASPLPARHLVGHIRRATHGACAMCNCHPFIGTDISGTTWIMAHNGVMLNESLLAGYDNWECGQTDSERVMMFLLDVLEEATIRAGRPLDFKGRFTTLAGAVDSLSNGNKLNLILDDGTYTYVHTNTVECTLFMQYDGGRAVVSTQALGTGGWLPVPKRRLIAFRDGQLVAISSAHEKSFSNTVLNYVTFDAVSA